MDNGRKPYIAGEYQDMMRTPTNPMITGVSGRETFGVKSPYQYRDFGEMRYAPYPYPGMRKMYHVGATSWPSENESFNPT